MKKKFIILINILAFISIGIFYADDIENYLEGRETKKLYAFPEDYVVVKSSEGIVVENKKDQLRIKIPEGWRAIKGTDLFGTRYHWCRNIVLYTPDYCLRSQQGCAVEIEITRLKEPRPYLLTTSANEIREIIKYYNEHDLGMEDNSDKYNYDEVVYVNQHEALKTVSGKSIIIKIPVRDKVYLFSAILFSEKCSKEFEEMLERIEIE